jgi:hypothetical protein
MDVARLFDSLLLSPNVEIVEARLPEVIRLRTSVVSFGALRLLYGTRSSLLHVYPALKAPGYYQTPLRGVNLLVIFPRLLCRLCKILSRAWRRGFWIKLLNRWEK